MLYVLTLIFSCGIGCAGGDGFPYVATVIDPNTNKIQTFATYAACVARGKEFMLPAADPDKVIRKYICTKQAAPK
jgi:hypothetical protein